MLLSIRIIQSCDIMHPQQCGITELSMLLRKSPLNYPCGFDQQYCTLTDDVDEEPNCYQCCSQENRLFKNHPSCPINGVCEKGKCVDAPESEQFGKSCDLDIQCAQLQCTDGICQQCRHGETKNQFGCIGGVFVTGIGATLVTSTSLSMLTFVMVIAIGIAITSVMLICLFK